jgi:5'-3' exonuclease
MNFFFLDGNWALWRAWSTSGQTSSNPTVSIPMQLLSWFCSYSITLDCQAGALAFDGNDNFRYDLYKGYKANRSGSGGASDKVVERGPLAGKTTQEAVYECLKPTTKLFESVGLRAVQESRYEADDVLNSASKKFGVGKNHVFLGALDKDMTQCINERVSVYIPEMQKKPAILYTHKNTPTPKKGLTPKQFLDYQILIGDGMDTVPPVPAMTEKKALELLKEFGSLSAYFKTKAGRMFYDLRATELHRNKNLVGLSSKAFSLKASDIAFKNLRGSVPCRSFTALKEAQTKTSLF